MRVGDAMEAVKANLRNRSPNQQRTGTIRVTGPDTRP